MGVHRRGLPVLLCLTLTVPLAAQTQSPGATPPAVPPPARPAPQKTGKPPTSSTPSLEFLEYLGEFETTDGQWIDPISDIDALEKAVQSVGQSQ